MRNKLAGSFFVFFFCVLLEGGCVTQSSQPTSAPVSSKPVLISNPNEDAGSMGLIRKTAPFSSYDEAFVQRVQKQWLDLLNSKENRAVRGSDTAKLLCSFAYIPMVLCLILQ
jgi:hypothetical protein